MMDGQTQIKITRRQKFPFMLPWERYVRVSSKTFLSYYLFPI